MTHLVRDAPEEKPLPRRLFMRKTVKSCGRFFRTDAEEEVLLAISLSPKLARNLRRKTHAHIYRRFFPNVTPTYKRSAIAGALVVSVSCDAGKSQ
jgi:hypothetical protein